MSGYVKTCKYCKQEIKMSNDSGKWNPYNKDGSSHDCRKLTVNAATHKQEITLNQVLRKLEAHGIIINVERLMAQ